MALGLGLQRFLSVFMLRMARTSHDSFWPTGTVIAAYRHSIGGWVEAPISARLALCCAALSFA